MTVAALYVDPKGPYMDMEGVDPWTLERDARLYEGPHPVVAHPPCADWSRLRGMAKHVEGRKGCAPRAVEQVRAFGGVLEHPAFSHLWHHMGMPRPGEFADEWGGWSLAVEQVSWGHRARKPTWLYIVGVHPKSVNTRSGGTPTHIVTSSRKRRDGQELKRLSGIGRRLSPPAFASWLVSVARQAACVGAAGTVPTGAALGRSSDQMLCQPTRIPPGSRYV